MFTEAPSANSIFISNNGLYDFVPEEQIMRGPMDNGPVVVEERVNNALFDKIYPDDTDDEDEDDDTSFKSFFMSFGEYLMSIDDENPCEYHISSTFNMNYTISTPTEILREVTLCPICQNLLVDPRVVVECGHVCCAPCLNTWNQHEFHCCPWCHVEYHEEPDVPQHIKDLSFEILRFHNRTDRVLRTSAERLSLNPHQRNTFTNESSFSDTVDVMQLIKDEIDEGIEPWKSHLRIQEHFCDVWNMFQIFLKHLRETNPGYTLHTTFALPHIPEVEYVIETDDEKIKTQRRIRQVMRWNVWLDCWNGLLKMQRIYGIAPLDPFFCLSYRWMRHRYVEYSRMGSLFSARMDVPIDHQASWFLFNTGCRLISYNVSVLPLVILDQME